jgi:hypothetical protein
VLLLSGLNLSLSRLLTAWAISSVVAWLITPVTYRLLFWLTDHRFVPWPVPVSVVPRAVVPIISVLTVPFGANTGVFRTRNRARPSSYICKASPFIGSMEAFLDTLSYSNALSSCIRYRDIGGFELLLKLLGKLRVEGHGGSGFILLR